MRKKNFLAVLAAACLVFGLVGCQQNGDVSTGQADTEQTVSETQQITVAAEQTEQVIDNIETTSESDTEITATETLNDEQEQEIVERTILENQLSVLRNVLMESDINCYITYGVIDYNNDGIDEFFAVFSKGNQGYNEMKFYSVDDGNNVNEIFSTDGFCRDGDTYFKYDDELSRLLIFSGYEHSYFLKNEKTEAVSNDGKVSVLFDSTWKSDSALEELTQTDTYINSSEVSADEYNNEYDIFMGKEYRNIIYIYDGKLYGGSEIISENENVYQDYLSRK